MVGPGEVKPAELLGDGRNCPHRGFVMYGVNVDEAPERGRMTEGQLAGFSSGWALVAVGILLCSVRPDDDAGVAAITAGSLLVLISTVGPTVAERLARSARPLPAFPRKDDLAEIEALMLNRFAEIEARVNGQVVAAERRMAEVGQRLDDLDVYVAQEVRGVRRRVAELNAQSS